MYTKQENRQFGKYEFCESQYVAKVLQASIPNEEVGDAGLMGWYGLVTGKTHTFIISENNQGDFGYMVLSNPTAAQETWDRIVETCDGFYEESEKYA